MRTALPVVPALLAATLALPTHADTMEARIFKPGPGAGLPYRWHAPAAQQSGAKYPLVIFLHGLGERGVDNQAQLKHGVKDIIKWSQKADQPCYLIAPQCPVGPWWATINGETKELVAGAPPTAPMKLVAALIDQLTANNPVDPDRVYLTGLSMGGFGSWFLAAAMPEKFAALVPVCGGGDPAKAAKIKDLPVWAFHGGKDKVVPPERSRTMVEALRKAGGTPKYTEYPGVGHDSWTATYRDAKMLEWMFAQHKERGL